MMVYYVYIGALPLEILYIQISKRRYLMNINRQGIGTLITNMKLISKRRRDMKRLVVVMMAIMALICLMVGQGFGADKLIVTDTATSLPGFKVTDTAQVQVGDQITDARSPRAFNVVAGTGGLRLWRVDNTFPPFVELINSTATNPDTIVSYWDFYAGFQYGGPYMFFIRDRTNGANVNRLTIGSNGYIGFGTGTSSPANPLQFGPQANNAYIDASGVYHSTSSRAYKDDINALSAEKAVEALKELTPVTYHYKNTPDQKHVGFIAEDVPELVAMKDRKTLSTMDIVAVLTKVVQEQNKTIAALSAKIDRIEKVSRERKDF
jgi:hypothetical protein